MIKARTTWAGTTTRVSSTVLRTAPKKLTSLTMRRIGSRLNAPLASSKARFSAWTIGQAKKTAMNRMVGASSR